MTYSVAWYDVVGLTTRSAYYGTNNGACIASKDSDFDPDTGGTQKYADFTPNPNASDKIIVTKYEYNAAAQTDCVTDNKGKIARTYLDDLGRTTKTIENYVDGSVGNAEYESDRTTEYLYDYKGRMTRLRAKNPTGTSVEDQDTYYIFGEAVDASRVVSVVYPDTTDTISLSNGVYSITSGSDHVSITYDRLGRRLTMTDQRGTAHAYHCDTAGRLEADCVTALGGADGTVRRIQRTYDDIGRTQKITSYDADNNGNIVNEVKFQYDGWGDVKKVYQQHDGGVNDSSPYVYYSYDNGISNNEAKFVRKSAVTCPNGRKLHYTYGTAGDTADRLSRIASIKVDSGGSPGDSIVDYTYMGAGTMVVKDYPMPDVKLDYFGGTSGTYAGFDQFGRVIKHNWRDYAGSSDIFDIRHGYDRASNRLYADRQVYKGFSQVYTYDDLHRLKTFKAGKINANKDDVPASWLGREQGWTLDVVGNQKAVKDFGQSPWYTGAFNKANEYDCATGSRTVKGNASKPYRFDDQFSSDTSALYTKIGSGDAFSISNGKLNFDTVVQDSEIECETRAVVVTGEAVGCMQIWASLTISANAVEGDYAGFVFGYQDPLNYWMLVRQVGSSSTGGRYLYQVVDGSRVWKARWLYAIAAGSSDVIFDYFKRDCAYGLILNYNFPNGYPAGKVGLVSSVAGTSVDYFNAHDDAVNSDLGGRWMSNSTAYIHPNYDGSARLSIPAWYRFSPALLKAVRLDKFRATFSVHRIASGSDELYFVFNAKDQDHYNYVKIFVSPSQIVPSGYKCVDGAPPASVAKTSDCVTAAVGVPMNDDLWVCVECDGSNVVVRESASVPQDWDNVTACYTSSNFTMDGGHIGFAGTYCGAPIDNVTVSRRNGSAWETAVEDGFELDSGFAEDTPTHDAAGNLTYDGLYKFSYDAWNRLCKAERAYREADGDLIVASSVAIMKWDGLGRRVSKQVLNSGDWSGGDCTTTYHYFYDGHSIIEERNGEGDTIRQYVWGTQYIDELVQIGINDDPADAGEQNCETFYWALQDANYNVMGIVDSSGDLKERYEYTPYGQRTVFKSAGSADLLCMSPVLESQPVQVSGVDQPYGLCDFGHQGLLFDKEFGWYGNRHREYAAMLARFAQRDLVGYGDATSLYAYTGCSPVVFLDPWGLQKISFNYTPLERSGTDANDPGNKAGRPAQEVDTMGTFRITFTPTVNSVFAKVEAWSTTTIKGEWPCSGATILVHYQIDGPAPAYCVKVDVKQWKGLAEVKTGAATAAPSLGVNAPNAPAYSEIWPVHTGVPKAPFKSQRFYANLAKPGPMSHSGNYTYTDVVQSGKKNDLHRIVAAENNWAHGGTSFISTTIRGEAEVEVIITITGVAGAPAPGSPSGGDTGGK